MSDLISRQAAIDYLLINMADLIYGVPSAQPEPLTVNVAREMDRETIEKLKEGLKNAPVLIMAVNDSAQPERKTGKWIMHPSGKFVGFPYVHYECDQCRDFEPEERNYCPNCGAKMEE